MIAQPSEQVITDTNSLVKAQIQNQEEKKAQVLSDEQYMAFR